MDAFKALYQWRQAQIDEDRLQTGVIKDALLSQIVRSARRTAAEIEPMLPRRAKPMAAAIAEVLDAVEDGVDGVESRSAESGSVESGSADPGDEPDAAADGLLDLSTEDFCEYEYGESDHPVAELTITPRGGGYALEWPEFATGRREIALYRVVSSDTDPAYKPEAGALVAVTENTYASDDTPPASAVRYLQVWCHVGHDVEDATAHQPVLIAQGHIVSPVTGFRVTEDEGTVIGQWSVWPGVTAVRVLRIPLEGNRKVSNDSRYRILGLEANLGGFVDRDAERGKRYLYRAICEAEVEGVTRLSQHTQAEVAVSVVLTPVTDLRISAHGGDGDQRDGDQRDGDQRFDLEWTNPGAGQVVVYRTESGPKPGITDEVLAESALELSGGLPRAARLVHPVVSGEASSRMTGVSWPRGWIRAYFTPVTVLGGTVQVGTTVTVTRPLPPVQNARVIERCTEQILTFSWPEGAASISVYVGPTQVPAEYALTQNAVAEVSRSVYERDGGLHFPAPLPAVGCSVHVVPVTFTAGDRIVGAPTTVEYPGLLRVWYDVTRLGEGGAAAVDIRLIPEIDNPTAPPFVLVHNPTRLPLSASDGIPLDVYLAGAADATRGKSFRPPSLSGADAGLSWTADVAGLTGFIRLFADLRPEHARTFALIDPPLEKIRLDIPAGGVR